MQTYSHVIISAALAKSQKLKGIKAPHFKLSAWIWGSLLPDLGLIILSLACIAIDMGRGLSLDPEKPSSESLTWRLFEDWFFHNPWVISLQNLFHSPLLLGFFILLAYLLWQRGWQRTTFFFWLFCGCMFHTMIDIPLHHDDGPLLLFPLNWNLRFHSPLSYWDPRYHGREFFVFEHLLDLGLILFWLLAYFKRRLGANHRKRSSDTFRNG
ncbi:MAG: hypothetical protein R2880_10640 [Deinococcales bacterium]